MFEFEDVKSGLSYLLEINNLETEMLVTENGKTHSATVKDLKELNLEALSQLAEMVGLDTDD
jgi:hypothetical protein